MAQNSNQGSVGTEDRDNETGRAEGTEGSGLVDRGAALATGALETGRDYVNRVRDAGQEYAERARSEAERAYEAGQQRAQEAAFYAELGYEEVSDLVRRNPAQSLALAAGVGFLIGLMIARR